jgi:hypothetical protein
MNPIGLSLCRIAAVCRLMPKIVCFGIFLFATAASRSLWKAHYPVRSRPGLRFAHDSATRTSPGHRASGEALAVVTGEECSAADAPHGGIVGVIERVVLLAHNRAAVILHQLADLPVHGVRPDVVHRRQIEFLRSRLVHQPQNHRLQLLRRHRAGTEDERVGFIALELLRVDVHRSARLPPRVDARSRNYLLLSQRKCGIILFLLGTKRAT